MSQKVVTVGVVLIVFSIMLFFITVSSVKEMKKEKGKSFLFLLLIAVFAGSSALLSFTRIYENPLYLFMSFQLVFFLLGVTFCILLYRSLNWTRERHFGFELLFLISTGFMSMSFFFLLFSYLAKDEYNYLFLSASILFPIPFFIFQTFEKAILIPRLRFKTWECPPDDEMTATQKDEMHNPFVVALHISKSPEDRKEQSYRAKAPKKMQFGKLIFHFIKDYNVKNSESPILHSDTDLNTPYQWVFFFKPKWYFPITRYIDPELSVEENNLKENSVVVCRRVAM